MSVPAAYIPNPLGEAVRPREAADAILRAAETREPSSSSSAYGTARP